MRQSNISLNYQQKLVDSLGFIGNWSNFIIILIITRQMLLDFRHSLQYNFRVFKATNILQL